MNLIDMISGIKEEQLAEIFPKASPAAIKEYTAAFNKYFPQYLLNTIPRIAAFLGQIGVESGELRWTKELRSKWNTKNPSDPNDPTGSAYEGRKVGLGNYVKGDGPKYIGRGILQVTGRFNVNRIGQKLGLDLLKSPELLEGADVGTRAALEYWKERGINADADAWALTRVTEKVNGKARLHHKERVAYSERARAVLNRGKIDELKKIEEARNATS